MPCLPQRFRGSAPHSVLRSALLLSYRRRLRGIESSAVRACEAVAQSVLPSSPSASLSAPPPPPPQYLPRNRGAGRSSLRRAASAAAAAALGSPVVDIHLCVGEEQEQPPSPSLNDVGLLLSSAVLLGESILLHLFEQTYSEEFMMQPI